MRNWRSRRNIIISLVLLVIVAQFAFFNPVRDVARRALAVPAGWLDDVYFASRNTIIVVESARRLSQENASLTDQVHTLQSQVTELQSVQMENTQLRNDLDFSSAHPTLKLSPADVIDVSNINNNAEVTIDKGSKDNVQSGQALVSQGYLIGIIGKVSSSTSQVKLLANRDVQVPVILETSRATGILAGGVAGLVVGDVPIDSNVTKGELVATTDLENVVPAGIPVGQVESVISQKQDIFLSVMVSSPINPATLTQVFIVSSK